MVNNISKKNAEIVLKLNKIGRGNDFEELEIPIDPKMVEGWVTFFYPPWLQGYDAFVSETTKLRI